MHSLLLLTLSLAASVQSWPHAREATRNLETKSLPIVDDFESMGTLPVAAAQPDGERLPGLIGLETINSADKTKRDLPIVDEYESSGTLPVAAVAKRSLPVVDEYESSGTLPVAAVAKKSLPVVDESESAGTLPVAAVTKKDLPQVDDTESSFTLPVVHVERPILDKRAFEMTLENRSDVAYYAQLSIGTPGQQVYAQLDTGSFELWVNPDCSNLNSAADKTFCEAVGQYDPDDSSTSDMTGTSSSITYGIGHAKIDYVRDNIALSKKTKLKSVQFGMASNTTDQFAGVLGLGHGKGRNTGYKNFIDELVAQSVIKTKAFGIALGSKAEGQGVITFGGVDTSKFHGKMASLPIIPKEDSPDKVDRYWVSMESISHTRSNGRNTKMRNTTMPVFLDTGATLTLLPPKVVRDIASEFGSSQLDSQGFYTIDCDYLDKTGTIDFAFDGMTVRVSYREIIREVRGSGVPSVCYLGIMPSTQFALLGDTFLRSAYVVLDQDTDIAYMAQYNNCGTSLKTINRASDIARMVGTCGPTSTTTLEEVDEEDEETETHHSSASATSTAAHPTRTASRSEGSAAEGDTVSSSSSSSSASATATASSASPSTSSTQPAFVREDPITDPDDEDSTDSSDEPSSSTSNHDENVLGGANAVACTTTSLTIVVGVICGMLLL